MRYVHTNVIARDWRALARFYIEVFGCVPLPPERDLRGEWLDRATGIEGAGIRGIHLILPGYGKKGPTLEIFEYSRPGGSMPKEINNTGFAHIAFAVDNVEDALGKVLTHGGSRLGEHTTTEIAWAGTITFIYVRDPDGNIIELQRWNKG